MRRTRTILALTVLVTAALTGCTSEASHGSRVELYDSVDKLAADSSMVVVGSVQSRHEAEDMPGLGRFTLSDVIVEAVVSPKTTGAELPANARNSTVLPGDTVTVRQMGGADTSAPAEFLSEGERYILFLTPTMVEGPASDDYYVTGVTAGIYVAADAARGSLDGDFEHYDTKYGGDGDNLPPVLSPGELLAGTVR